MVHKLTAAVSAGHHPTDTDATAETLAEAVAVAHRVAVLAETDPAAPLVVATRAALDIAEARQRDRRARRQVGREVHGGDSAWWARWAEQWMPASELAARRVTGGPATTASTAELGVPAVMRRELSVGSPRVTMMDGE